MSHGMMQLNIVLGQENGYLLKQNGSMLAEAASKDACSLGETN
jgi:hypothetical protein